VSETEGGQRVSKPQNICEQDPGKRSTLLLQIPCEHPDVSSTHRALNIPHPAGSIEGEAPKRHTLWR